MPCFFLAGAGHLVPVGAHPGHAGIAPVPVWSANPGRHRLTRSGNRQINAAIHRIALTQARMPDTLGHAYYEKKKAENKTPREAMRCLKRRMSDAIYRQLQADAAAASPADVEAGPGGHSGASQISSAAGSHPHTGTSDQPLPGPAASTLPPASPTRKSPASRTLQTAS